MASGHVNRTNRPNTWLYRPSLRREDSSCQLGAVHTWPEREVVERELDPTRAFSLLQLFAVHVAFTETRAKTRRTGKQLKL
jgi:hypothetical protein